MLRHDRARGGRLRPHPDPHQRLPGRRGVGAQRAQVVHFQCSPGHVRHPYRTHRGRPRPSPGRQHGLSGGPSARRLDRGATDRDHARLHRPLRDPYRGPTAPRCPDAGRPRPGSPAGPVPARPRPAGALHALDRPGRDGPRHDGRPLPGPVQPRLVAGRKAGHPVAHRRLDDGALPVEAHGAPRRLQDRPG